MRAVGVLGRGRHGATSRQPHLSYVCIAHWSLTEQPSCYQPGGEQKEAATAATRTLLLVVLGLILPLVVLAVLVLPPACCCYATPHPAPACNGTHSSRTLLCIVLMYIAPRTSLVQPGVAALG